jgi:hypothetical protein
VPVVTVGTPWRGSTSAARVNRWMQRITTRDVPALADMAPQSRFLACLHDQAVSLGPRLTNVYSTREIVIRPYVAAHVPLPGTHNVLIATAQEYAHHLRVYGMSHPVDEHIEGRVTHLGEMSHPQVRAVIWRTVETGARDAARG